MSISSVIESPLEFNQFNISTELLQDFLLKARRSHNTSMLIEPTDYPEDSFDAHSSDQNTCESFCDGEIRIILGRYNKVHLYLSIAICIFGIFTNSLNIAIFSRRKMMETPIVGLLKWLAVCDLLLLIEYIPFIYNMQGDPNFTYIWALCLFIHMHFSNIIHITTIFMKVILAVWHFAAIKYTDSQFLVYMKSYHGRVAAACFVLSIVSWIPVCFGFHIKEVDYVIFKNYVVDTDELSHLYSVNFWIHSVITKILPCLILSAVIVVQMKRNRSQSDKITAALVVILALFLITELPHGIMRLFSGVIGKCFFKRCYTLFGDVFDLLALINASVNFVIFWIISLQFRETCKELFSQTRQDADTIDMFAKDKY